MRARAPVCKKRDLYLCTIDLRKSGKIYELIMACAVPNKKVTVAEAVLMDVVRSD